MKVISRFTARPAMDGDGVNIKRVADFMNTRFDPYLMIDEIKSADKQDFIGGFPPHPHRGIETFTYIRKGGFEHRDQLGNVKAIRAGDVQWMSTGSGVIHSEMPLADAEDGLHGFQIWLNMPAKDKMRPAIYQDTSEKPNPIGVNQHGATLKALAGKWQFAETAKNNEPLISTIQGLSGNGAIADLMLDANGYASIDLARHEVVHIYIYQGVLEYKNADGELLNAKAGELLVLSAELSHFTNPNDDETGLLLLAGSPINEKIVHMGPFVMNTQAEIDQAVDDYQQGRFGKII
ncbi:pirin family protein [Shewanella donghaensis]|uniref:pirin family protein n=1 Tax=Shewanella donghaensis TaxID=238836 RepID=UPI00118238CB|nr:pirin family protein [Shewanella donghaensis]